MENNRQKRDYWCQHCRKELSKTTYFQHKMLYYDPATNRWAENSTVDVHDTYEDFKMSDGNSESDSDGATYGFDDTMIGNLN